MELSGCREMSQNEFADCLGISPATLVNWFSCSTRLTQVEAALRMLERLPGSLRNELLAKVLRVFPTIESAEFAHMPTVVTRLRSLIKQSTGLTVIRGSDSLRTFVFSSMAHSIIQSGARHGSVQGIDVHAPDWFVPVPGITYVRHSFKPNRAHELASLWPRHHVGVLMLNGVCLLVREWHRRALSLINNQHVIIADEIDWEEKELKTLGETADAPIQILDIGERDSPRISIEIRSIHQP